jgi:hypothetical protein
MLSAVLTAAALFLQAAPAAVADAPSAAPTPSPAPALGPATSVAPVTVNGAKSKSANLDPGRLICHNETVLGTLFPKKVCATQREMAERRDNDRQVTDAFQRAVIVGPPPWTP